MRKEKFEILVAEAVESLPEEFKDMMDNVDVVVEAYPNRFQLDDADVKQGYTLLGLYEGVPITERGSHYGFAAPDKITIFQKTIEQKCGSDEGKIKHEIQKTVRHEIAHHFGIDDERLSEIEKNPN
jgi:predicted Zn-dependent protease with MMP-like domain